MGNKLIGYVGFGSNRACKYYYSGFIDSYAEYSPGGGYIGLYKKVSTLTII